MRVLFAAFIKQVTLLYFTKIIKTKFSKCITRYYLKKIA